MNKETIYQQVQKELAKDFGERPIEDVGRILTIVQASEVKESEVIPLAQYCYTKLFVELKRGNENTARQSWVVASGNNFEGLVRNFINDSLNSKGILSVKGDRLLNNPRAKDIVNFLTLQANRRCTQTATGVWPDSDIVVLTKEKSGRLKVFALLSCKTSDHSRNDAVLFWALALRNTGIKYCLVTQDLDDRYVKGDSDPRISNIRRKSEAYLDRIYTTNPLTVECTQVRKLDFKQSIIENPLLSDLVKWQRDIVPNCILETISESALT